MLVLGLLLFLWFPLGTFFSLPVIVIALRMIDRSPRRGCWTGWARPRWQTWGSANTSSIVLTGPAGTPTSVRASTHSAVVRRRSRSSIVAFSSARFSDRRRPLA